MKKTVIAINGSPRKSWNTANLLTKALEGAASQGAETELIHLYDLNFKGCTSCFACKRKGGKSYGKCAMNDDLTPVLEKVESVDAIILGSPIYLGAATGEMRSFMERLVFPYIVYDENYSSLFKRKIPAGFIYTMNVTESMMQEWGYDQHFKVSERMLGKTFGLAESLCVTDTYQFDDYSKYVVSVFDPDKKAARRKEVFPQDCEKAYNMGMRFAKETFTDSGK
ncbi:MAG TPA: flavodoxin family protein [Methylomusa anaerophila]|uniref:2-amino-4-deoxychorismate dehydrogenase n=1 Tax=Methylomusa anaerophila TaxID=1930071 RepID=A0A348AMC5_9FIRM|nr:flavodoxin family protein [Methylomusa anaerophila]BBB92223.1 2-amino-4-deoxychorismate dehydrogenase [Methylomusa anaerophila]HML87763.1 flavodoxin family protein [Methylomusa anaerophila]